MAAVQKPAAGKPGVEEEAAPVHRIRITLTSRNVSNLEKGAPPTPPACAATCSAPRSLKTPVPDPWALRRHAAGIPQSHRAAAPFV